MTLDEAIKHCEEKAEELYKQAFLCHANPNDDELDDCIECAKEHEQLAGWLTELQERRKADRWIPVSERLPDKNGRCIVTTDFGDVCMDSFVDGIFVLYLGNVIAWQHLPEPYKKETTFDDYLKEQLKDPEFRKEWEKLCEEDKQKGGTEE